MPVNVIGTLKPKNNGKFPVAEAVDIKVTDDLRLDEALENKAELSTVNFALSGKADNSDIDNLQAQINELITSVTEDAEVQNARVGSDSTTYDTLKQRLDTENIQLKDKINYIEYGSSRSGDTVWTLLNSGTQTLDLKYTNNSISSATGAVTENTILSRATSKVFYIPDESTIRMVIPSEYTLMARFFYDINGNFIGTSNSEILGNLCRLLFKMTDDSDVDVDEIAEDVSIILTAESISSKINNATINTIEKIIGKNKFDITAAEEGYLKDDGTLQKPSYLYTSDYIDITGATSIAISPRLRKYIEYNENHEVVANTFINDETANAIITPNPNSKYCRFSFWETDSNIMLEFNNTITEYAPFQYTPEENIGLNETQKEETKNIITSNGISDKTFATFGDSIMHGAGNNNKGILDIMIEKYGCTGTDFSVSGASCAYHSDRSHIVAQIESAIENNYDPDIIIINGLSNDIVVSTLGTLTDSFDYVTKGYATFVDGLEYCFGLLKDNYPTIPIIYVIPHSSFARDYDDELAFGNMAREICHKWSIPIADIYKDGNITARVAGQLQAFTYYPTENTGTHPNQAGYEHSYIPLIYSKIKEILLQS